MNSNGILGVLLTILLIVLSAGCVANQSPRQESLTPVTANVNGDPSSQSQSSAMLGSVSHAMSLSLPAKGTPEKILVYKTIPPDVSRRHLEEYTRIFHVNGTFKEGTAGVSIQSADLSYYVMIEKSGVVDYGVQNRPNDALDTLDKLPSDEEAVKIATQFLKENNLYPDGIQTVKADRHYAVSTDKNGNEIRHSGQIDVWFGRTINNLKVWGTQLEVTVGGNGDIIGYYANWRDYAPVGEYPIKSPESAFEDLEQIGIKTDMDDPSISITEATLAYRTKAGAYKEEYLEPIWVFSGEASSSKEGAQTVSKFIPALTDDAVKSLSSV